MISPVYGIWGWDYLSQSNGGATWCLQEWERWQRKPNKQWYIYTSMYVFIYIYICICKCIYYIAYIYIYMCNYITRFQTNNHEGLNQLGFQPTTCAWKTEIHDPKITSKAGDVVTPLESPKQHNVSHMLSDIQHLHSHLIILKAS